MSDVAKIIKNITVIGWGVVLVERKVRPDNYKSAKIDLS